MFLTSARTFRAVSVPLTAVVLVGLFSSMCPILSYHFYERLYSSAELPDGRNRVVVLDHQDRHAHGVQVFPQVRPLQFARITIADNVKDGALYLPVRDKPADVPVARLEVLLARFRLLNVAAGAMCT